MVTRPDPECPHCHGSGQISIDAPFLDRVDETTLVCRCMKGAVDPSEEDTLIVHPGVSAGEEK